MGVDGCVHPGTFLGCVVDLGFPKDGSLIRPKPKRSLSVQASSALLCLPLPSPALQREVKGTGALDQREAWCGGEAGRMLVPVTAHHQHPRPAPGLGTKSFHCTPTREAGAGRRLMRHL